MAGERRFIPQDRASAWPRRQWLWSEAGSNPSLPIRISSAAAVVPPGEVTFSRSVAASSCERCNNSPAPATVSRASFIASSGGKPRRDARLGQAFGQQKNIGGAGAGNRRHRIDQLFVLHPLDGADGGKQIVRERLFRRVHPLVRDRDRDPAADRSGRVGHAAHDRGGWKRRFERGDRAPRHDRDHHGFRLHERRELRAPLRRRSAASAPARSRRARMSWGPDRARSGARQEASRSRAAAPGRARRHGWVEAAREPAFEQRTAHLARAHQQHGAMERRRGHRGFTLRRRSRTSPRRSLRVRSCRPR